MFFLFAEVSLLYVEKIYVTINQVFKFQLIPICTANVKLDFKVLATI